MQATVKFGVLKKTKVWDKRVAWKRKGGKRRKSKSKKI